MRPLKVRRREWTFPELRDHFRISENDLRRLVIDGVVQPAAHFRRPLFPVTIEDGLPVVNFEESAEVEGWLWVPPEYAKRVDNLETQCALLRDQPVHSEDANYFALPEPITLSDILPFAVVFDANVQEMIAANQGDPDRDLSSKEEKTRDKLIALLAAEHLGWRPWEPATDIELSSFLEAARGRGLPMSRNCVKAHLKLAWERVEPDKDL